MTEQPPIDHGSGAHERPTAATPAPTPTGPAPASAAAFGGDLVDSPGSTGAVDSRVSGATAHAMSPERQRLLRRLTPTLLMLGAFFLVVFESTITLLLGVVLLFAAVACGVVMIAEPGFLAGDDPD